MPKTPSKPRIYATLKTFCAALDVPITTLSGWIRHPLWRWNKKAPWSHEIIPDVLRWAADELERGRPSNESKPATPGSTKDLRDEKLRQEIRKLRAHADQAETALSRERGALHDAGDCDASQKAKSALIRNQVQNLTPQIVSLALSNGLPHEAAPALQGQIEELCAGVLRFLSVATLSRPLEDSERVVESSVAA